MKDLRNLLPAVKEIVGCSRNLAVSEASATYIKISNADDFWRKGFEKRIAPMIKSNELQITPVISFGNYDYLITNRLSL